MVLEIKRNFLKLVSPQWMQIVPVVNNVKLTVGMKLPVESEKYGQLGVAEVEGVFECHVYELTANVMAMSDGDLLSKERLTAKGGYSLAKVQVVRLRFVRRSDAAFKKLLDVELVKSGLEIVSQSTLQF